MDILAILFGGLIVGALARLVVPGPEPIGCLGTIAIGVVGGAIGGFVGTQLVGGSAQRPLLALLFSVLGAVVLLLLLRAAYGRGRL